MMISNHLSTQNDKLLCRNQQFNNLERQAYIERDGKLNYITNTFSQKFI